jgi:hypothetical protein
MPPFADKINRIFFNYKAPYYSASLIPKLIIWNIWLFFRLLLSNSDIIIATDLDTAFPAKVVASVRNKKFVYDIADLYRDILPLNYP